MSLSDEQSGVVAGIIPGAAATLLVLAATYLVWRESLPEPVPVGTRLALLGFSLLPLALALTLTIMRLARHRFFSAEDIDGGGLVAGSEAARIYQAVLQNTLEQGGLAMLVYAAWAFLMSGGALAVLPAASVLFLAGRILFIRGYAGGAAARALGFALTFYPTVLLLAVMILALPFRLGGLA